MPVLEEAEIGQLSKRFADAIPEGEMSVCAGFLHYSRSARFSRIIL
jgi:hypothetical protein